MSHEQRAGIEDMPKAIKTQLDSPTTWRTKGEGMERTAQGSKRIRFVCSGGVNAPRQENPFLFENPANPKTQQATSSRAVICGRPPISPFCTEQLQHLTLNCWNHDSKRDIQQDDKPAMRVAHVSCLSTEQSTMEIDFCEADPAGVSCRAIQQCLCSAWEHRSGGLVFPCTSSDVPVCG